MTSTAEANAARYKADAVSRLDFMVGNAALMREHLGDGLDIDTKDALDLLAHVKKARRSLKGLENVLEDVAIAGMDLDEKFEVQGDGYTAILHQGSARKEWRSQDLAGAIVNRYVTIFTARFPRIDANDVKTIVSEVIWNFLTIVRPQWRSRPLAAIQLNADDFSRREPGLASIEIRGKAAYDTYEPDVESDD
ncbi:hypothetical protein GCM10025867_47550 (plasmid) [Frondihabitans sucicola]|uniref:Uncharacterized protein n=1 Tax=Frondihabitans sucicola TaxID=1268041 RepID=A0ABN6Y5B8_9MICO|nr:hypothetical protein [Frondihabitans sucicola]BDZ52514.1 hypothetical protein GCM10025867_47550 [Frondihabitans sucicola]